MKSPLFTSILALPSLLLIFNNPILAFQTDLIADEIVTIPTLDQLESADSRSIMTIWENIMSNFVPSDMLTFDVPARKNEILFEDIEIQGTSIKGAYFVSSSEDADIDFSILGPGNQVLFNRKGKQEGVFYFTPNDTGSFSFSFNNKKWVGNKQITFALHTGKALGEELVNSKDLTPMEAQLTDADRMLREIQTETRFAYKRQGTHYKTTESNHNKVFYMSLFESLTLLTVTVWQVYYIKRLLDNRRII